jgi:hypothetical protein
LLTSSERVGRWKEILADEFVTFFSRFTTFCRQSLGPMLVTLPMSEVSVLEQRNDLSTRLRVRSSEKKESGN